ncbi:hypothetical protein CU048_05230 [Beijerinckiaceae bacterium]|nr:hypothetical protein CU048_05230 [Beijerinckiaceae bacterium]
MSGVLLAVALTLSGTLPADAFRGGGFGGGGFGGGGFHAGGFGGGGFGAAGFGGGGAWHAGGVGPADNAWHAGGVHENWGGTWHGDGWHAGGYYGGGFHGPVVVNHYYNGGCWNCGGAAAAAAYAAGAAAAAYAIGSMVVSVPVGCPYNFVDGINYYVCDGTWFQPLYGNNGLYYRVVAPL